MTVRAWPEDKSRPSVVRVEITRSRAHSAPFFAAGKNIGPRMLYRSQQRNKITSEVICPTNTSPYDNQMLYEISNKLPPVASTIDLSSVMYDRMISSGTHLCNYLLTYRRQQKAIPCRTQELPSGIDDAEPTANSTG